MNEKNYSITYTVSLNIKASGRNITEADNEAWDRIQEALNDLPAEVHWEIEESRIEGDFEEW